MGSLVMRRAALPSLGDVWAPTFFCRLLVLALCLGVAHGQELPAHWKLKIDEAEEAFFDGRYDAAVRLLKEAKDWLGNRANQDAVFRLGHDHTLLQCQLSGFEAEVYAARGEIGKARQSVGHALAMLEKRRAWYVRNGKVQPKMWQFEAFLHFVEGDVQRPLPDFGLASEVDLPGRVAGVIANRRLAGKSGLAYQAAAKTLSTPMALADMDDTMRRLQGRLHVSLALDLLAKQPTPNADQAADAESHLQRAMEFFEQESRWKEFVAPSADLPFSFRDIDKQEWTAAQKLDAKRNHSQSIMDWLSVQLARVELAATQELAGDDALEQMKDSAEQVYDRILSFLKTHYGATHPLVQKTSLSQARWYMYLAFRPAMADAAAVSYLDDAIVRLQAARDAGIKDRLQGDVLEVAARRRLLELDKRVQVLEPAQRAQHEKRLEELLADIEKRKG